MMNISSINGKRLNNKPNAIFSSHVLLGCIMFFVGSSGIFYKRGENSLGIPGVENLFIVGAAFFSIITIIIFLFYFKTGPATDILLMSIIYYFYLLIITLLRGGDLVGFIIGHGAPGFVFTLVYYLWLEYSPDTVFRANVIWEIIIYINFLMTYAFPDAFPGNLHYIWLHWNKTYDVIMPTLFLCFVGQLRKHSNRFGFRSFLLTVVTLLTVFADDNRGVASASTTFCCVLFIVLCILIIQLRAQIITKMNYSITFLLVTVITLTMTFLKNFGIISWFFQNVLNRSATASGRITLWQISMDWIKNHPILGYGYLSNENFTIKIGHIHPHSKIVYTLFVGGIILLLWLLCTFLYATIKFKPIKKDAIGNVIFAVITVSIISFFSELRNNTFDLYPILIIACYTKNLQTAPYVPARPLIKGKFKTTCGHPDILGLQSKHY